MIAKLKPYPAVKDSGVEWLGEVPEHWEVLPVGRIGQTFKGNGGNKGDEVLTGVPCVRYGDLYTRHEFFITSTKACVSEERAADYTPIHYGDVLFAASGETIEDIGRSAVNLIRDPAVCGGDVLLLRPGVDAVPEFLGYVADAPAARAQKATMGRGFTIVHIYGSQLKRLLLPLPPLPEQAAIVKYLNYVDRRVRRLIRAKRKLITLLTEQKQAIIHRAVTRGLDPGVPLKDSGVEWLGEVPEHWEVVPLKRISKIIDGDRSQEYPTIEDFVPEGIPFLSSKAIKNGRLRYDDLPFISQKKYEALGKGKLQAGDIVMTVRGTIGNCALFIGDIYQTGFINAQMMILRSDTTKVLPLYLLQQFRSSYFKEFLDYKAFGSAQKQLTNQILAGIPMPMPSLAVQTDILHSIDKATAGIDSAITHANREIELLREYRTRLIADVVTGKLDVREAAAALPEVDPLAAKGEPDDTLDNNIETDLDELDPIPEEDEA